MLAEQYVRQFEDKWLRQPPGATADTLLGNSDVQSLADFSSTVENIGRMRLTPINRDTFVLLAVITVLPLGPLLLTVISVSDLVERVLKVVL
jgi:hypothetical protein